MRLHRSILYAAGMIAALACLSALNRQLVDQRRALAITPADPLINAPPLVSFTTVALGGFRGVVADLMWIRMTQLQQEGQFFEITQLADWITKLEPRSTEVWAYHAWNLAYNISVMIPDLTERWRWVAQGIRLLRDEGLAYNPGDAELLLEIGWLYQNKIGAPFDDAHLLYKQAWALEMNNLLGGSRPDYETLAADPLKSRQLREDYKLDLTRMRRIDETHGPLDWLSPQAHAIYWATRALEYARGTEAIAAHRMIYQSMADAVWQGRIEQDSISGATRVRPRFELLPYAIAAYETAMTNAWGQEFVRTGYVNFLRQSAVLFFMYDRPEANQLLALLRETDSSLMPNEGFELLVAQTFLDESQLSDAVARREALLFIMQKAEDAASAGDPDQARAFEKAAVTLRSFLLQKSPGSDLPALDEIRAGIRKVPAGQ